MGEWNYWTVASIVSFVIALYLNISISLSLPFYPSYFISEIDLYPPINGSLNGFDLQNLTRIRVSLVAFSFLFSRSNVTKLA